MMQTNRTAQRKRRSKVVDLVHPAVEKVTLALEGIGAGKVRVNSSSLDHPLTILSDQAIEIVAIEKKVMVGRTMRSAYWLNHDPSGLVEAGPSMSVDLVHPAVEKVTLVLEGIGMGKVGGPRRNSSITADYRGVDAQNRT